MLTVQQRVANGVAFLDRKIPKWRKLINLKELNLGSCSHCILGQICGEMGDGLTLFKLTWDEARDMGFEAQYCKDDIYDYPALNKEWLRVLREKQNVNS